MEIEHLILAHSSSLDKDTNTLSIFNLFEDITINRNRSNSPITIPMHAIVIVLRGSEKGKQTTEVTFSATTPDNKPVFSEKFPIILEENHKRYRLRINFQLPIASSGDFQFEATVNATTRKTILGVNTRGVPKEQARSSSNS